MDRVISEVLNTEIIMFIKNLKKGLYLPEIVTFVSFFIHFTANMEYFKLVVFV